MLPPQAPRPTCRLCHDDDVVAAGDNIQILFTINVDSNDVGEEGQIYVAIQDDDGNFMIINENSEAVGDVVPFDTRMLTASETVELLDFDTSVLAGLSVTIFVGYTVDDIATVIFNEEGVPFSVVE